MIRITNLRLPFDHQEQDLVDLIQKDLGVDPAQIISWRILKRSLDARKNKPLLRVYSVLVEAENEADILSFHSKTPRISRAPEYKYELPVITKRPGNYRPVVVGTGPAGLFAGLILAEAGLEPILLERGKEVIERTRDTLKFWNQGVLDPESNTQFGEGGAGTFSDGKLQTRVKDKGNRDRKVLEELANAGAPAEIMIDHKPHLGTDKLVTVVKNIRAKIEELGGQYHFNSKVVDLLITKGQLAGVRLSDGREIITKHLVLAVGHSARDTYEMLHKNGVQLEPKPFSVGFRIEHPQTMIDQNQYGSHWKNPELGPADYQLACHTSSGRTVYSFCMCPGGTVIAASSEAGHLVTNGMSLYKRDGDNANSAIVVEVMPKDFGHDPLAGVVFQRSLEKKAFKAGGRNYFAPIQLAGDFLAGKLSSSLGSITPTYLPGVKFSDLSELMPEYVIAAIKEGLIDFNRKIKGFTSPDAVLTGVETRTSAPLRIVRGKDHQSVAVQGLYPAGEGSGYAGGIMSSAIDGIKTAEMVLDNLND
jgi:uncharacterized FAD-dependent dehydrogenase